MDKTINRQMLNNSKGCSVKRNTTYYHDRNYAPVGSMAVGQSHTSRSEPDLAWHVSMPKLSVPSKKIQSNKDAYLTRRSTSQFLTSAIPNPQPLYVANGSSQTKSTNKIISSQTHMSKTNSRPSITEATSKTKGQSGLVGK